MKKLNDDKFLTKWKPLHEKGAYGYVVSNTLHNMLAVFFVLLMSDGTLMRKIIAFVLGVLISVVVNVSIWSSKEKKYKEIEKVSVEIVH